MSSDSFSAYIERLPLSMEQQEFYIDGLLEEFPRNYQTASACDWVNPDLRGETLKMIYVSGVSLKNGITYTLLKYDDDCYEF